MMNSSTISQSILAAMIYGMAAMTTAQATIPEHDQPVLATQAGSLLSIQPQSPSTQQSHAAQRYLITYRSRGPNNEPIVSSAFVLIPKGKAPKTGWPILAWAHGTTGVADTCAPSNDSVGGPIHDYQVTADRALNEWLARGYAVVATDYQGLGTPGGHPYMDGKSQLHSVVDSVRALHAMDAKLFSPTWYVMGHSQGGAAALSVAAYGQKDAPELNLAGAIALAPGGYQYAGIAEFVKANPQPDVQVAAFFPIILLGAEAADPKLNPDRFVSPDMQSFMLAGRYRCLSELQSELTTAPKSIFQSDVDLNPLIDYLKQQSIENFSPTVPLLVIQGAKDQLVNAQGVDAYVRLQCQAQKPVRYQTLPQGSHRDALSQSGSLTAEFIQAIQRGESVNDCEIMSTK